VDSSERLSRIVPRRKSLRSLMPSFLESFLGALGSEIIQIANCKDKLAVWQERHHYFLPSHLGKLSNFKLGLKFNSPSSFGHNPSGSRYAANAIIAALSPVYFLSAA